jgi:hypothetical protein
MNRAGEKFGKSIVVFENPFWLNKTMRAMATTVKQYWQRTRVLIFIFFTFPTLLLCPQIYFHNINQDKPAPWGLAFGQMILAMYLLAAATPLIFWLGKRFPIERSRLFQNLALHFILRSKKDSTI